MTIPLEVAVQLALAAFFLLAGVATTITALACARARRAEDRATVAEKLLENERAKVYGEWHVTNPADLHVVASREEA